MGKRSEDAAADHDAKRDQQEQQCGGRRENHRRVRPPLPLLSSADRDRPTVAALGHLLSLGQEAFKQEVTTSLSYRGRWLMSDLDKFFKEMGLKSVDEQDTLKVTKNSLPEETQVVVLKYG